MQNGLAVQPEGVGALTGARPFRAPATLATSLIRAYGRRLAPGLSAHLQADHWRILATHGRSLWEGARLRESRLTAVILKRAGRYAFALQSVWRFGLSGSLAVSGRSWALSPWAESGVWLTCRRRL